MMLLALSICSVSEHTWRCPVLAFDSRRKVRVLASVKVSRKQLRETSYAHHPGEQKKNFSYFQWLEELG